ncbi:MFS transporter [Jatrophihabitans sp.]|uniref:MFS transporter n=1 Tax=Jatrophihabitans sp. TaxID=1932789 RepID=UPI002C6660A1|nr:MFS transporter [Jatrophihabitans sp.]
MSEQPARGGQTAAEQDGTASGSGLPGHETRIGAVWQVLGRLPGYCRLLIAGVAVNRMASFVQVFAVLYLTTSRHWPPAAAGLALTFYGIGTVLGVSAGGVVTDRLGCRNTIAASMFGAGISVAALAVLTGRAAIDIACGVAGIATQLFRPAAMTLLAGAVDGSQLVLVAAGYRFGLNLGALITPLVGAALAARSWTLLFVVDAATSLLFGVVALVSLPHRVTPATSAGSTRPAEAGPRPGKPLRDPRLLWLVLGLMTIAVVESQYISTLPLEVVHKGLPTEVYAAMITANALLVTTLEPTLTGLLRNRPVALTLPLGVFLIGAGIACFGLPGGIAALVLATVIWTSGEMIGAPPAASAPALMASEAARPRYLALAGGAQSLGYAIGPSLGTVVYATNRQLLWGCCVVGGCLATACCWASGRHLGSRAAADRSRTAR